MNRIVLIILLIVMIGYLFEIRRRNKSQKQNLKSQLPTDISSASEAYPTQTGKFRVQQMLAHTAKNQSSSQKSFSDDDDEDEEALPDPFDDQTKH